MKRTTIFFASLGAAIALSAVFAADKKSGDKSSADIMFVRNAADGGMTEVELGKVAEKNGQRNDVKSFGRDMVKDHSNANDNLKAVASKINATVPDKLSAKHQTKIDKMSKMSGDAFDKAYIKDMVEDHEKDIAEFEKARGEVSSEELKKFIDNTVPVMKHHLEMAKKMQAAK
jgi:putative membrane protein